MSYKTILVHVDKSGNVNERIKLAAMIAMNENAHLTGVVITGISRFMVQAGLINDNDPNLAAHLVAELDTLRKLAKETSDDFARSVQKLSMTKPTSSSGRRAAMTSSSSAKRTRKSRHLQ
jgi:hypothetical protein